LLLQNAAYRILADRDRTRFRLSRSGKRFFRVVEFFQACASSRLSNSAIAMRGGGAAPSNEVIFPPPVLRVASSGGLLGHQNRLGIRGSSRGIDHLKLGHKISSFGFACA
jgi:hypothetical protein